MRRALARTFVVAGLLAATTVAAGPPQGLPRRFVYASFNLLVAREVEALEALMTRARAARYTGVLLADAKFGRLPEMDARYTGHCARVRAKAEALGLELVPAVFPIGYSEGLLAQAPDLAEALPVRDALFVVHAGEARLVPDPAPAWRGGDMADLAAWSWNDAGVVADDGAACVRDPQGKNARLVQTVRVRPFRQYHVAVRVRTQDFRGEPEVKVLAKGAGLAFSSLGVAPTQPWTVHHVVFNSLEHEEVTVYLGCWGGGTGTLWWDDATLEEVGLVNLVRRDGAPLVVRREGGEVAREGRDYEPVVDPRMGTVPWRGGYEVFHAPPTIRTRLPEGTRLRVSYHHAVTVHDGQVTICPSEPRTLDLLRDQARRMHALWGAKGYFMSHDEIRVGGWDEACARRGLTAGQLLADNVRACTRILREVNPHGDVYVWSDMFDPAHNAHAGYYLVRGDLAGAWEGLDPSVIVACWNHATRAESLRFFAGRGHRTLIAGYYDAPPERVRDWLDAARGVPGVVGVAYTTWARRYDDLERFQEIVDAAR